MPLINIDAYTDSPTRDDTSLRKGADTGTESLHTDDSGGDLGDESDADMESMVTTRKNASEFGYTVGVQNTSLNVLEKVWYITVSVVRC